MQLTTKILATMFNEGDGKVYAMIGAFALVVGFAALVSNQFALVDKKNANNLAHANLDSVKQSLEIRAAKLESIKSAYEPLKQQDDIVNSLTEQKQRVTKSIEELKKAKNELSNDFVQKVKKVRASSAGSEFPQLNLMNGQVLTETKIKAVSDTEFTISHSGGVARVSLLNLPQDLKSKYRIGMIPMIDIDKANLLSAPLANVNPGGSLDPAPATKTTSFKMSELTAQNNKLVSQRSQLELAHKSALDRATNYQNIDSRSRSNGRITSLHTAEINQANQEAASYMKQILALNAKISEIQIQMNTAKPD